MLTSYTATPDGFFPTLTVGGTFAGTMGYDDATPGEAVNTPFWAHYNDVGGKMTTKFSDGCE
jgi:hypothetical protein